MQLNLNLKLFKPEVVYMTGVGHGSPHVYTGHNGMPIFKKGRYLREEVENKVLKPCFFKIRMMGVKNTFSFDLSSILVRSK